MKTQLQAPLLGLGICFAIGILMASKLSLSFWPILLPPLLIFLILFIWDRKIHHLAYEKWMVRLIIVVFLGLGFAFAQLAKIDRSEIVLSDYQCDSNWFYGKLSTDFKRTPYGYQAFLGVEAIHLDSSWKSTEAELQFYVKELADSTWQKGQYLLFQAYIKPIFSSGSEYHRYLLSRKIEHLAYAKKLSCLEIHRSNHSFFDHHRKRMSGRIDSLLEEPPLAALAKAMFLGDKSGLKKEQKVSFTGAGLSHILAISGLHVGIVFICLNLILFPLNLILFGRKIRYFLVFLALLYYMLLCGAGPSVVRAVCMFGTILLFRIFNKRFSLFNVLAISAWIQMLLEPNIIFDIGFQLSYTAVFALIYCMPSYQAFVKSPYPWLNALNSWLGVSLIASLATLPLCLYYFEQFPVYFLLSNVLASLISFSLVFLGFLFLLFLEVPLISDMLAEICSFFLHLLDILAEEIVKLPHAVLTHFSLTEKGLWILLIELVVMACLIALARIHRLDISHYSFRLNIIKT
ncbi:MAG: ComEC/Rec2 family competence protein [Bacteroidota bacterium]